MPPKHPFRLYLRSRLSGVLAAAAAILVALALVFLPAHALVPIIVIVLVYAAVTVAVFFSRRGAREVVQESEEDRLAAIRRKISSCEQLRERISVLRLPDEQISKAVEYFLQESGSYLQKCRELSTYSPRANERIERVLEICQVFLGERDEESTGRRYGLPGSPQAASRETAEGFSRDIIECAQVIRERTAEDLLGVSDSERLAITKKLEEDTK